jgi:hypothetical protein
MTPSDSERYRPTECEAEFEQLFPHGFAGPDVVEELAPEGWEHSPLRAVFHPSPEQVYEESLRVHRNLQNLRRPDDPRPVPPEPTREEVTRDFQERPVEPAREVGELVGMCLWDIFSDNHDVVAPDGRVLDIGSFRAAGGFLAELLNRQTGKESTPDLTTAQDLQRLAELLNRQAEEAPDRAALDESPFFAEFVKRQAEKEGYDYIDFYMGTAWVAQRADLTPVYRMIFRRLRQRRLDWVYQFPRLYLVDLRPLQEALEPRDQPEWVNYSPSEALAKEAEAQEREQQLAELRESLDEGHREAVEQAAEGPPPRTVQAYRAVYGRWPRGWPPVA